MIPRRVRRGRRWVHSGNRESKAVACISCDEQGESKKSCKQFHSETCCCRIDRIPGERRMGAREGYLCLSSPGN